MYENRSKRLYLVLNVGQDTEKHEMSRLDESKKTVAVELKTARL
jgi:hypothetical protein